MSSTAKNPSTGRTGSCPYTLASPGMSPRKSRTGGPISFKSTPPPIIAQTRVSRRFQRFRPPFTRTLVLGDIARYLPALERPHPLIPILLTFSDLKQANEKTDLEAVIAGKLRRDQF